MMVLLLLLILRAAADKHSIRPGDDRNSKLIRSNIIYYNYYRTLQLQRRAGRSRLRFNIFRLIL